MLSAKPLKTFLFPLLNILLGILMLCVFFTYGRNVVRTFKLARMSAVGRLMPSSMDYFWKLNIGHAPIDKPKIRYYADFYENMLKAYPALTDAYGILGCCYHYLGDDAKASDYLDKAIFYDPLYSWNYYNLAVLDIRRSRYQEAADLLQRMLHLDPTKSLERLYASQYVYDALLKAGGKGMVPATVEHLKTSYMAAMELVRLINQSASDKQALAVIKKMDLELYAF
ncbi:MAG: hypothetical protein KGK03_07610 [Candidatus Omnitrophica bacterium]|nr:hypothetical protein [Candidatus Omnitrophota bacterium]MDE2222922.1 hypothetical protein [Candidatus Omnitrophota bacterium]